MRGEGVHLPKEHGKEGDSVDRVGGLTSDPTTHGEPLSRWKSLSTCFLPRLPAAAWAPLPLWPGELLGTCRRPLFWFSL